MESAVIGLIGVVVGALLSGTTTFIMAQRAEARQARAAARLLEAELRSVAEDLNLLTAALTDDNVADLRALLRLPPQRAWDAHKPLLAAVLTSPEWYAVAAAYESLDYLRVASSIDDYFSDDGRRVHDLIRFLLKELASRVQAGASAVSRLAGNPQPQAQTEPIRAMFLRELRARGQSSDDDQEPQG
jgi:hypothetical protein